MLTKKIYIVVLALLQGWSLFGKVGGNASAKMLFIKGGYYCPLFKSDFDSSKQFINSFFIDAHPVTNEEYLKFVTANPEWRKSNVKKIFADANYLRKWKSDLVIGNNAKNNEPVTDVSWFAANAYCKWIRKRLPTVAEWEYAASKTNIISHAKNQSYFYEWTFDFNESNIQASSICGGAGASANNPKDYLAFLRFSFRNTLKANYSLDDLGFRCAAEIDNK
jgi:sulfatase modifying factor 1